MKTKVSMLFKLLHGLYHVGIPVGIYSKPGMGKTSILKFLAKMLGVPIVIFSASRIDIITLDGVHYVDPTSGKLKVASPEWVDILNAAQKGILFIDEITTARPSIQALLLTLIQDCQTNNFTIPETTFRVCAGNWNDVAGTHEVSLALTNREVNLFIDFDTKDWVEGYSCGWSNYEEAIVETNQDEILKKRLKYNGLICGFLKSHYEFGHNMPEDVLSEEDIAYASGRSWENVEKALAILDKNEDEYLQTIICGLVGDVAGTTFWKFIHGNKKIFTIDLVSYVGKEDKFNLPDPKAKDQVHHIMNQTMILLSKDPVRFRNLFIRVVNLLHEHGYDGELIKPIYNSPAIVLANVDSGDMEESSKIITELAKKINDWNDLHILSSGS